MTRRFAPLRTTNWNPSFTAVLTVDRAAQIINLPHEDYPKFVPHTKAAILNFRLKRPKIETDSLTTLHGLVFQDAWDFAGQLREVNVRVGPHVAPHWDLVRKYLQELEYYTNIQTLGDLLDWYVDFETIHPFQDGNGRVGGIVAAILSKQITGYYHVTGE